MKSEMPLFYDTEIQWKRGRSGTLQARNLPVIEVSSPPEFKGEVGRWTPEHLFVASVNVCFMTTFLAIAELSKLEIVAFSSSAQGKLEKVENNGLQMTEIVIRPKAVLPSGRDFEHASRILEKAERNCLISNSIKTAIKVEPELYNQQDPAIPCPPVRGSVSKG